MTKPRKRTCKIGDVFALTFGDEIFAFARVINLKASWDLAEVLAVTASVEVPDAAVLGSAPLYPPIAFHLREVEFGRVKTVAETPAYVPTYLEHLRFATGRPGRQAVQRVNQYRPDGPISDAEAAALPKLAFYAPAALTKLVQQILKNNVTVQDWLTGSARLKSIPMSRRN